MKIAFKNPNTYIVLAVDALLLYFSYLLAYWLRFESFEGPFLAFFWQSVGPVVFVKLTVFSFCGLQSGMWRYTGVVDFINIIKATVISFVIIVAGLIYIHYPDFAGRFSRSVFVIDGVMTVGLISLFRLSIRISYSKEGIATTFSDFFSLAGHTKSNPDESEGIKVAIFGADDRGELLIRSLTGVGRNTHLHYDLVGLIDDNPSNDGASMHGHRVLGPMASFGELVERFGIKELLVASRVTGEKIEEINEQCKKNNVACRVIPGYFDDKNQEIDAGILREIEIEDLLFRDPVEIDHSVIEKNLKGRRVMITGAGGSIGSELAHMIERFDPSSMILVDKSENDLFRLQMSLNKLKRGCELFVCADICHEQKMESVFVKYRPEVVFHTAAYKHVPMMQSNMDEAIRNNISGMKVISDMSDKYGVEKFILISTDKAVDPINVMGATKRVCELYLLSKAETSKTRFMAVRFGNVLGSNGSVAPIFLNQIKNRGPVTVTHPDIERYFMTIHEAVGLILQTATLGQQGSLYHLDMGKPVRISDLAEKMIRIAGFEPNVDIDIVYTGLRDGEKVKEKLIGSSEKTRPTSHAKILNVLFEGRPWDDIEDLVKKVIDEAPSRPEETGAALIQELNRGVRGATIKR